jgi:hypothetical protein
MTVLYIRNSPDPLHTADYVRLAGQNQEGVKINTRTRQASRLMDAFATETGLTKKHPPRRYLWTDAHAVCNWLALEQSSGDKRYLELALMLVSQVHEVLGKHRPDDTRVGWISGLGAAEGYRHPTIGGLRIGKPEPERPIDAPADERAEWQQDGQYYHYLTKWMHALHQVEQRTGQEDFGRWAAELAVAAQRGFCSQSGPVRLYWKMSIDLSYPLVTSMGHHDPLDGLITCLVLNQARPDPALDPVIAELVALCRNRSWLTDDPLGLGGLLFDAGRLAQLQKAESVVPGLLHLLLVDAVEGLVHFTASPTLRQSAHYRLAFRELGLAIGLQAVALMRTCNLGSDVKRTLQKLEPYLSLQMQIEAFWRQAANQTVASWTEHKDINAVMLATSLVASGFLSI